MRKLKLNTGLTHTFSKALELSKVASQHKATNIRIFRVQNSCSYADYFIVMTATSTKHAQTLAQFMSQKKTFPTEGLEKSNWVVVDLGDIFVHIFLEETRSHYHFDKIWGHVPNEPFLDESFPPKALKA